MQFYIGENVIYPPYGIAVIANITERNFGSDSELCYQLRVFFRNINAVVPAHSTREVGLRKLANQAETKRVLSFLGSHHFPMYLDWKTRNRDNAVRLQSGELLKTAEVYKGLMLIGYQKQLTAAEKTMLADARRLVASEICAVTGITEADAVTLVQKTVERALRRCSRSSAGKPSLRSYMAHA
jgi:CarD family transcriptional regulator